MLFLFFFKTAAAASGMSECLKIWGGIVVFWGGGIIYPPVAIGLTNLPKYRGAFITPATVPTSLCFLANSGTELDDRVR